MTRRDAGGRFAKLCDQSRPIRPTHYRHTIFRRPRGPWRSSHNEAFEGAKRLGLTAYDASRREHYLAVPTEIQVAIGLGTPE